MSRYDGLQVVKKTYNGVTIGYVVGWWTSIRYRWMGKSKTTFRSFRNGVVFKTQEKAEKFRDSVETRRKDSGVKFEEVSS